jgi:hypothetical protein
VVTQPELNWTKRKLLQQLELGGRYASIVGAPDRIADELESWVADTGIDGYNLTRTVTPESFEDFVNLVIPVLQERGSYKRDYARGPCVKNFSSVVPPCRKSTWVRVSGQGGGRARLIISWLRADTCAQHISKAEMIPSAPVEGSLHWPFFNRGKQ